MCGINAIKSIRGAGRKPDIADIKSMAGAIAHRGPDEAGFSCLDDGRLLFSHVRLSIIDLQTGQQPLFNDDGSLCICINGELYDYGDHRRDLERRGFSFRTSSDTEVLLKLYEADGTDAFRELNGEFAFLIWDGRNDTLLAVRDRFGVKPLFHFRSDQFAAFSSEVKGLFQLDFVDREFDPDYFVGNLMGAFNTSRTPYKGVSSVLPGHFMTITGSGHATQTPYWQPAFDVRDDLDFEEAKVLVADALRRAVTRRMVADVPVGTYLSGGLDSALVCALVSEQTDSFTTFNVGFGSTIYDESALAERVARHYGARFESVDCDDDRLASGFSETVYKVEIPLANPNAIAKQVLSRLVRSTNHKVCITGEGSDEIFGGYAYFKQERLLQMLQDPAHDQSKVKNLYRRFQALEKRSHGLLWSKALKPRMKNDTPLNYLNFQYLRARHTAGLAHRIFNRDFLNRARFQSPMEFLEKDWKFDALNALDPFNATRKVTFDQLSSYIIPTLGDRVEMANSVECRTPFLDKDLVDLTLSVPPEHFVDIWNLREKHLLRESSKDLLPEFLHKEHKHPFLSPSWREVRKTEQGRSIFEELLSSKRIRDGGVFNTSFVRTLKAVWALCPHETVAWRNVDTLMGMICTTQSLDDQLLNGPPSDRRPVDELVTTCRLPGAHSG